MTDHSHYNPHILTPSVYLSRCLAKLWYLEYYGIAQPRWELRHVLPRPVEAPRSCIDTTLPRVIRPFQYTRYLASLTNHVGFDDLSYFMVKLGFSPGGTLTPPGGRWRSWIDGSEGMSAQEPVLQSGPQSGMTTDAASLLTKRSMVRLLPHLRGNTL